MLAHEPEISQDRCRFLENDHPARSEIIAALYLPNSRLLVKIIVDQSGIYCSGIAIAVGVKKGELGVGVEVEVSANIQSIVRTSE